MNRSDGCPDLEAWRLFHAGDVSEEEELERLAAHQEACAACRAVLAWLDAAPLSRRYELRFPEIGGGGMGILYAARDVVLNRDVAVKVLREDHQERPELKRRFIEEAQITAQLQHPGIPPVHDLGVLPDGRPFLVMKLIKGQTLTRLLRQRSSHAHDLPRFLSIFEHVCQAVAYAHARAVIHRDLKPDNVMVGEFGEVQVMDWGIAKSLAGPAPATEPTDGTAAPAAGERPQPTAAEVARTQPGHAIGTWAYMPPEQASGQLEKIDCRADVFSLGAMLCQLLTGQPPYVGKSEAIIAMARQGRLDDCFERLDCCGAEPELVALGRHCLVKDPTGRPANAGEVAATVAAFRAAAEDRARNAELRVERDRANMASTCQIAERLEGEVQKLQQLAHGIATAFVQRGDWSEEQLVSWLTRHLRDDERITNLTLAFEPYMFQPDRADYCLLVGRTSEGIVRRQLLLSEGYPSAYREDNWYARPLRRNQATWTGPELCLGVWTVCYEVPLRRGGECVGVMAVDLPVSYFTEAQRDFVALPSQMGMGPKSYGFVIGGSSSTNEKVTDRAGTFICHPQWQPPQKITELGDRAFHSLAQRILWREPGWGTAVDPWTGRPSTFLYAPIRSADWSFVAVVEEGTQHDDQRNQARDARQSLSAGWETSGDTGGV
jgi:serine/threonine protein kinase